MSEKLLTLTEEAKQQLQLQMDSYISNPQLVKRDAQTGCLLWLGAKAGGNGHDRQGQYSRIRVRSQNFFVGGHIAQCFLKTGRVPSPCDGEQQRTDVSHLCHRPACINPDHLLIETHQLNQQRTVHCAPKPGRKPECRAKETHCPPCYPHQSRSV